VLWIQHVDGVPFRKLGDQLGCSGKQAYLRVREEMERLPWSWELTRDLCNVNRYCHVLVIDGKYVAVAGFERKIPFVYGIDYETHDIPFGDLYAAEDERSFSVFFGKLRELGYEPRVVVADDRAGLKQALSKVFPRAKLQLCQVHYLENIRQLLKVRTDDRYAHFFSSLVAHVFRVPEIGITAGLRHVLGDRCGGNKTLENIVHEIVRRRDDLFAYLSVPGCPRTTNIIESYNSHLEGRLKSVKGFQSFETAQRWLNGCMVRRRTKKLTDCGGCFKRLNGHASLELGIKKQARWPGVLTELGVRKISYFDFQKPSENSG
jgi:hypothetical protein